MLNDLLLSVFWNLHEVTALDWYKLEHYINLTPEMDRVLELQLVNNLCTSQLASSKKKVYCSDNHFCKFNG